MTTENAPTESTRKSRKAGRATIAAVLAELESTVHDVRELAGDAGSYDTSGARLVKYGANADLVAVAVVLADTDYAPSA